MQKKGKLYIGTSGWVYSSWEGIFYPQDLKFQDKLRFFSENFKTTEVNYSFYHLPRPSTYQKWYAETPLDFVFAVKASRFITHIKRLKGVRDAWKVFLDNALNLKEKLGPILFQFPPSFKATSESIDRLEKFLRYISKFHHQALQGLSLSFAFEFRHQSWCDEKIYNLLKQYRVAWVIADSSRYPKSEVVTANFVYLRMHGPGALFASKYTKKELEILASKIKKWLEKNKSVYCYFNNDFSGYAVENARMLLEMCS